MNQGDRFASFKCPCNYFCLRNTVSAVNSFLDFYLCSFSHLLAGCIPLDMNTGSSPLCFCRWNCKVLETHCIHSDLQEAKADTSVLVIKICHNVLQNVQDRSEGNPNPQSRNKWHFIFSFFKSFLFLSSSPLLVINFINKHHSVKPTNAKSASDICSVAQVAKTMVSSPLIDALPIAADVVNNLALINICN